MWGYSELGRRLAGAPRSPEERYARWVDLYASADFAELADWCREVVDDAAAEAGAAQRDRMREAFRVSSRYELAFWEMAWRREAAL
jgi:thiaminase/transcriptional activator TenA